MEFDKSKVYTALNADELKVGDKCIFANNLDSLKCKVEEGTDIRPIIRILNDSYERRFKTEVRGEYPFAYFISEPEKKKWIVYLCRTKGVKPYLTACESSRWESAKERYGAKTKLFVGTEDEATNWYVPRRKFADVIAAWEDGEKVQLLYNHNWISANDTPEWSPNYEYRIKPKCLKWNDLKVGDVIRRNDGLVESLVTVIDKYEDTGMHILAGTWLSNRDLEDYYKVDEYWETVNEKD